MRLHVATCKDDLDGVLYGFLQNRHLTAQSCENLLHCDVEPNDSASWTGDAIASGLSHLLLFWMWEIPVTGMLSCKFLLK